MTIGIITHWWSKDNYGQLLQCYALQRYLMNIGNHVYLIRYNRAGDPVKIPAWKKGLKLFNPVALWRFIQGKCRRWKVDIEHRKHPRGFNEFMRNNINVSERVYCSYNELRENPPKADVYITGSDQVWNFFGGKGALSKSRIRAFCLDFGTKQTKRIAWAASFGRDVIEQELARIMRPLLKEFEYTGVREKTALDICGQCGIENAEWTPDPSLLLDAEKYRSLYKNEFASRPEEPYCFLYLLGNDIHFPVGKIYAWAKQKGLSVIYVTGNSRYDRFEKTYATIPEWLCLLDNAEYVITNSFHGAAFSFIFQKKFGVIPLTGRSFEMNNRFLSLFEMFAIEPRFVENDIDIIQQEPDWNRINSALLQIRDSCKLGAVIGSLR